MISLYKKSHGFTLIELLVVIAIIGMLSSIVLASLNSARAKARDAKVVEDFHQVQQALILYYDKYGVMPNTSPVTNGSDMWWGNFNNVAQQLVTAGFLVSVPVAPTGHTYNYYNYGAGLPLGGLLVSQLESLPLSSTGYYNSCRYTWGGGNTNWCNTNSAAPSDNYCICNPY